MFLVLLHNFSESQDSVIGYRLCEKLVEEGFDLLVTSTSRDEEKQAEIEVARRMTETLTGSVRIIETEPDVLDAPTPERIFNFQRTHFPQPATPDAIEAVIGTLPGTVQSAVELKKMYNLLLVLVAVTKVSTTEESLKAEVIRLVSLADEVWSVGSDIYLHYEGMFREQRENKSIQCNRKFWILKQQGVSSTFKEIIFLGLQLLRLVFFAEEIWPVGSDFYLHYERMFREHKKKKTVAHKEILLGQQVSQQKLSKFLRTSHHLWILDLSVLQHRPSLLPIVHEEDLGSVQYPDRNSKKVEHANHT